MYNNLLCSDCFQNNGLKYNADKIGTTETNICPNCKTTNGKKLNQQLIEELAYQFFVRGSFQKDKFGGAPKIQFNKYHFGNSQLKVPKSLDKDIRLIENILKIGFFYYDPRFWMLGENEPLKALQSSTERKNIISRILKEYPVKKFCNNVFYRLRRFSPAQKRIDKSEFDSPPQHLLGNGRIDSPQFPVMYGNLDLETCIHECRASVEDNLFVATLQIESELRFLDLTKVLPEPCSEFESLDIAVHMLFSAGEHSYEITRELARAAQKENFDGLIFPSYFSSIRNGTPPLENIYGLSIRRFESSRKYVDSQISNNLAIFGYPIKEKKVLVSCINKLVLNKVSYDIQLGIA